MKWPPKTSVYRYVHNNKTSTVHSDKTQHTVTKQAQYTVKKHNTQWQNTTHSKNTQQIHEMQIWCMQMTQMPA